MRSLHFWKQIAIATIFLLTVDGCFYRDPGVDLPHGYSIAAISPGSPCVLCYSTSDDERAYSKWNAYSFPGREAEETIYQLSKDQETLTFPDETSWRTAIAEKHARHDLISPELIDITSFNNDDQHAIGHFEDGYFLLDFVSNNAETFANEAEWQNAVAARTKLAGAWMWDPKSLLIQTRHGWMLVFYVALLAFAIYKGLEKTGPGRDRDGSPS